MIRLRMWHSVPLKGWKIEISHIHQIRYRLALCLLLELTSLGNLLLLSLLMVQLEVLLYIHMRISFSFPNSFSIIYMYCWKSVGHSSPNGHRPCLYKKCLQFTAHCNVCKTKRIKLPNLQKVRKSIKTSVSCLRVQCFKTVVAICPDTDK